MLVSWESGVKALLEILIQQGSSNLFLLFEYWQAGPYLIFIYRMLCIIIQRLLHNLTARLILETPELLADMKLGGFFQN